MEHPPRKPARRTPVPPGPSRLAAHARSRLASSIATVVFLVVAGACSGGDETPNGADAEGGDSGGADTGRVEADSAPGDASGSDAAGDARPSDTDATSTLGSPTVDRVSTIPIAVSEMTAMPGGGWAVVGPLLRDFTVGGETIDGGRHSHAVARLNENGETVWAQGLRANGRDTDIGSIATDTDGNVYLALYSFSSSVDFGDGVSVDGHDKAQSGFVAKLTADGSTDWGAGFQADKGLANTFVAARGTRVVIAGTYTIWEPLRYRGSDGIEFGPRFNHGSDRTSFVLPLDRSTGAAKWLKLWSADRHGAQLDSVALLDSGKIAVSGDFEGGPIHDPNEKEFTSKSSGGFVGLLDTSGSFDWVEVVGTRSVRVATDGTRLVASGQFEGSTDLGKGSTQGPGIFTVPIDPSSGSPGPGRAFATSGAIRSTTLAPDGPVLLAWAHMPGSDETVGRYPLPSEPGRWTLAFQDQWSPDWLSFFPANEPEVTASTVTSTDSAVAVGGAFGGPFDFGDGELSPKGGRDGFVLTVQP